MATARDLIAGSLRLIGALAAGETPSADEQASALSALNGMLDSWSSESLSVPNRVIEKFPLIAGQATYTMGPLGDFDTVMPLKIESAGIEIFGSGQPSELPVRILNLDEWASITVKNTQSPIPTGLYVDDTFPLRTLNFWPVPSDANSAVIYSWKKLSTFPSANTILSLPPGYERALRYNLAVEIAPEYGKSVSAEVAAIAAESKANIKRMNSKPSYLRVDDALLVRGRFNIYTGGYN